MNWNMLIYLLAGHAICDYPLQGDYLAKGKNHGIATCVCGKDIVHVKDEFWRLSNSGEVANASHYHRPSHPKPWLRHLFDHCIMHCAMVLLVTGSIELALAELGIHMLTDWLKCDGRISANTDQAIHYGCKVLWWAIAVFLLKH